MIILINTLHAAILPLLGIFLNLLTIRLILRHTMNEMRIYSRILLQTCITDILTIFVYLLIQPVFFADNSVGTVWSYGPAHLLPNPWQCICFMIFVFMARFATNSISSLFIYRYLMINWNVRMNVKRYAFLLLLVSLPILVLPIGSFLSNCPTPENEHLTNPKSVELLELDNQTAQQFAVTMRANGTNALTSFIASYGMALSITNYAIIIFCGFSIQFHIWRHYKGPTMKRQREVNKLISIVLCIQVPQKIFYYSPFQAILPVLSFLPQIFTNINIIFGIQAGPFLNILSLFSAAISIWISMLNPLVTSLTIETYRKAFFNWIFCYTNSSSQTVFTSTSVQPFKIITNK